MLGIELGLLGEKQVCYLCALQPSIGLTDFKQDYFIRCHLLFQATPSLELFSEKSMSEARSTEFSI